MFKSDHGKINCVKCIVCFIVKGKDVILGSNYLRFKRMQEKQKLSWTCHIWARRKESFMWTKNATNQNWSNILLMKSYFHCWIADSRRFEGEKREGKGNILPQFCIYYSRANLCWSLRPWNHYLDFSMFPWTLKIMGMILPIR
jgi:hypothetical protein